MTTYIPTTDQVRSIFVGDDDWTHTGTAQDREEEFDAWYWAARDDARAQALEDAAEFALATYPQGGKIDIGWLRERAKTIREARDAS